MAVRRILQLGDPDLRRVSEPAEDPALIGGVLNDLEETLAQFRHDHGFGRGISAIQIGEPTRIIFIRMGDTRHELVNPEWLTRSEELFEVWDDCFSFPHLMVRLLRHRRVSLRYYDRQGAEQRLSAEGDLSELLQHEMDHLDGILAVDRAVDRDSFATRDEWQRQNQVC